MKKHVIDSIVFLGIGLVMWFISFYTFKPFAAETYSDMMRYYSDSFMIPSVILISLYILTFVARKGFFDGLTYSFKFIGQTLIPFLVKPMQKDDYYKYKMSKEESRKQPRFAGLLVGILFLIVAIVFYILYKIA